MYACLAFALASLISPLICKWNKFPVTVNFIPFFMQAILLAAGFGTRLKPYSNLRPKPLFPVLNRPLLHLQLERLQMAGLKMTSAIKIDHHAFGDLGQVGARILGGRNPAFLDEIEIDIVSEISGIDRAAQLAAQQAA